MSSHARVNAEKALKTRPDLVPGELLRTLGFELSPLSFALKSIGSEMPSKEDLKEVAEILVEECGFATQSEMLQKLGHVMAYGRNKHGHCSWRDPGTEQAEPRTHWASCVRHIVEYMSDKGAREEGSALPVLWHALCQVAIVLDLTANPPVEIEHLD